jgi:hypothetical protein
MTPQSTFMVLATVTPSREAELRGLLDSMNAAPGWIDPANPLLPLGQFANVHFARFVLLEDETLADIEIFGVPRRSYPLALAFVGDVDGEGDDFLREAAARAGAGLRAIFACCDGFSPQSDLLVWMRARSITPAASYVNWPGRTVRQVREEAALHDALLGHVRNDGVGLERLRPREAHAALRRLAFADVAAGRLRLSPEMRTPFGWRLRNLLHLLAVPVVLLLLLPVLPLVLVGAVLVLLRLRHFEKTDPELPVNADPKHVLGLAVLEDHDVTNQFTALGSLKPGRLRLAATKFFFFAIDYTARHLYGHGGLARVRTIHFARWVFLNDNERVVFMSSYDGSHEAYMDDFINKVGFGLNVAFGNGVGWPRTKWLLGDGCSDELRFKEFQRRHQIASQVFYKAYPGLTATDLDRNQRIRQGVEAPYLSDREAREWLALL